MPSDPFGEHARLNFLLNGHPSKLHLFKDPERLNLPCFVAETHEGDVCNICLFSPVYLISAQQHWGVQVQIDKKYADSRSIALLVKQHRENHTAFHGIIMTKAKNGTVYLDSRFDNRPLDFPPLSDYCTSSL